MSELTDQKTEALEKLAELHHEKRISDDYEQVHLLQEQINAVIAGFGNAVSEVRAEYY